MSKKIKDTISNISNICFCFSLAIFITHFIASKFEKGFHLNLSTLFLFFIISFFIFLIESLIYIYFIVKIPEKIPEKV